MNKEIYNDFLPICVHTEREKLFLYIFMALYFVFVTISLKEYFKIYNKKKVNDVTGGDSEVKPGRAPISNPEDEGDDKNKKESWKDWIERNFVYILLGGFASFVLFCVIASLLGFQVPDTPEDIYRQKVLVRSFTAMNKLGDLINAESTKNIPLPKGIEISWDYCHTELSSLGVDFNLGDPERVKKAWTVVGKKGFGMHLGNIESYFQGRHMYTPEPHILREK